MFNLEDYTTVKERIDLFWSMHPMGRILTYVVVEKPEYIVCRTELYRDDIDTRPFATGHAKEVISERGVNRDFALENCETSSVGIACKNAKIGTEKNSISREEAEKVNRVKGNKWEKKVENFTREKVTIEKPSDPWIIEQKPMPVDLDEALTQLNEGIKPTEIPMCKHGARKELQGVSKYNKPYYGMVCPERLKENQCEAIWYVMDKSGRWIPPKPAVETGELN
ncbi:hypothetical protein EBT25_13590 [bacterium]|nr:hypothetical protein [bacterium]